MSKTKLTNNQTLLIENNAMLQAIKELRAEVRALKLYKRRQDTLERVIERMREEGAYPKDGKVD